MFSQTDDLFLGFGQGLFAKSRIQREHGAGIRKVMPNHQTQTVATIHPILRRIVSPSPNT